MSWILVVEKEQRYVERISEALSPEGWSVEGVHDRASAVELIAQRPAGLVILNSEIEGCRDLVDSYSRRAGGPGTVLLIPESAGQEAAALGADEVVQKPFTAEAIRQAVRRCLSDTGKGAVAGKGAAAGKRSRGEASNGSGSGERGKGAAAARGGPATSGAGAGAKKGGRALLTSEDIFGEMVSELESSLALGAPSVAAAGTTDTGAYPRAAAPAVGAEATVSEAAARVPEPKRKKVAAEPALPSKKEPPRGAGAAGRDKPAAAPRRDPTQALEERIRQAAEEGKRRAKAVPTETARQTRSADDLLRNALLGIGGKSSEPPPPRPARASKEEVDELLSTVVGLRRPGSKPARPADSGIRRAEATGAVQTEASRPAVRSAAADPPESGAPVRDEPNGEAPLGGDGKVRAGERTVSEERVGAEEAREVEATAAEATSAPAWYLERSPEEGEAPSPVLEVYGHAAERGLRVRAKLIWAIIIIVFLALLGFIFASRAGAEVAGPPAASGAGVERLAARESGASETSEPRVVAGPPRRDGQACRS